MFEKDEAFNFISTFLEVENAVLRVESDKRGLLDEISYKLSTRMPFQCISLLSVPHSERRKPTQEEMKENYTAGIGGLCFDVNTPTFFLLSSIGYDMSMMHCTVSSTTIFHNNHVVLIARNVEKGGDSFLVDVACGHPTFSSIDLSFEKESPVYRHSYLEYKYIKLEGQILRMQRKGDPLTARGVQENSEVEFWIDGWRRFYAISLDVETKDLSEFYGDHESVYKNAKASPFHLSQRVVTFPDGKAVMVINDKTYEDINGELVITPIEGGDEAIMSKIKQICPVLPQQLLPKSLQHWRQDCPAAAPAASK